MIPFPDISPELFSVTLFGVTLALRWYALAYIVGILIGWRLVVWAVRRTDLWSGPPAMSPDQAERLLTWMILAVILGGRLGYVLFYDLGRYLADPAAILRVWEGGMAFHGGFLGVVVAGVVFCRREGLRLLPVGDMLALAAPAGLMLGRTANFINAELWGRATTLPWGVIFPGDAAQACAGITGPCARHPSQLYEAALEGLVLGVLILWMIARKGALHKPGLVMGTFVAGYALARFAVEFVRQPDAQFVTDGNPLGLAWHIGGWGLTMGQILSLPMLALGLWFATRAARARRAP